MFAHQGFKRIKEKHTLLLLLISAATFANLYFRLLTFFNHLEVSV